MSMHGGHEMTTMMGMDGHEAHTMAGGMDMGGHGHDGHMATSASTDNSTCSQACMTMMTNMMHQMSHTPGHLSGHSDAGHYVSPCRIVSNCKVHWANMGPIWDRQDPGGPHVGPVNFAIWVRIEQKRHVMPCLAALYHSPTDAGRKNNVIITSKRRHDVVLTEWWRCFCATCPLGHPGL